MRSGRIGTASEVRFGSSLARHTMNGPSSMPRVNGSCETVLLFAAVWGALFFRGEWARYGVWMACCAALVGAGLLARSFLRLTSVDPGYRTGDALVMDILIPWADDERETARNMRQRFPDSTWMKKASVWEQ